MINKKNKIKNVLIVFILLFCIMLDLSGGYVSYAAETDNLVTGKCGENVLYELNKTTGVLRICGTGPMEDYQAYTTSPPWDKEYRSIITKVKIGYGVTTVGMNAFRGNRYTGDTYKQLNTVEIASTVTNIGMCAFLGCENLKTIVIPDRVKVIGNSAFCGTGLTYVDWGNSIQTIEDSAFEETKLTELNLPISVQAIGCESFYNCQELETVIIPDNCEVKYRAFADCNALNNVSFGENCKIHAEVFNGCSQLTEITLGEGSIGVYSNPENGDTGVFYGCSGLESILLPDSWGFYDGSEDTYAYVDQFRGCINLKNISFHSTNEKYVVVDDVIYSKDKKVLWYYPLWLRETEYEIPDSVISIARGAFLGQDYLQHVQFSSNISQIGWGAFNGCSKLNNVILPEGITELTGSVFSNCQMLKNIVLPVGLSEIYSSKSGGDTFGGGTGYLETVYGESGSYAEEWAGDKFRETIYCSFDANGGVVDTEKQAVIYGDKYWKLPIPTREGYQFLGWYTQREQGSKITNDTTVSEEISHTLYAHWDKDSATTKSITNTVITLETTKYTYDGTEKKPSVKVKDGSVTLALGVDYTVSYTDNVKIGIAKVIITGMGNYTGTISKTFRISEELRDFIWNKDNWNFNNSSYQGYFSPSKMIDQIDDTYLSMLKVNLTNSEYRAVFDKQKGWIYDDWGGSCYGMSSTALLAMENFLPYSEYKLGADTLNQLDYPVENAQVSSLITYYQMLQVKDVIQQQYRTVPNKSNKENIQSIISQLDANNTVLVCFKKEGWGAHAILAYGYEYGSYTWDGVTYQGCIKICDPNSSIEYNSECNIYFNTNTYNWTIPYYSYVPITSVSGAKIMYAGADIDMINCGGYLSGITDTNLANFVARIDAAAVADNRSVTKVKEVDGNYIIESNAPTDIIEDYSFLPGGESKGTIGYNLYDANASYQLSQNKAEKLQLSMDYEDCYLEGGSSAGNKIVFDKDGYVSVWGESADYNIAMTFDDDYPTDWFTIQINGENSDEISLEKEENGYILSGDNLENVEVNVNNRDDSAYAKFTTKYTEAYIYEINKETVGVKVDTDNNGTYETQLDTEHLHECDNNWESDAENHWNICSVCGKEIEIQIHNFQWIIDQDATTIQFGSKHEECTVCGYKRNVDTIINKLPTATTPILITEPDVTATPHVTPTAPVVCPTLKPSGFSTNINMSDNQSDIILESDHSKKSFVYAENTMKVGRIYNINQMKYKITKYNKNGIGEVALIGTVKTTLLRIKVGNTVSINGVSFKVTSIGKNAFNGCKKLTVVSIGKNVKKIGTRAFYGCKKLKKITIKSKKLNSKSVGSQAFKGIHKKAIIKVPKKQKKTYRKWLKKKGITTKVKIK